jgi:(p)ppGpp synthase/HD superfamily hydrolase
MDKKRNETSWQRAVSFAVRRHAGQLRKDGQTPYFAHPVRVTLTVRVNRGLAGVN